MRFSERHGHSPTPTVVQIESLDRDLRVSLWNVVSLFLWSPSEESGSLLLSSQHPLRVFFYLLYMNHFKWDVNEIEEYWPDNRRRLEDALDSRPWFAWYDFLEFCVQNYPRGDHAAFVDAANRTLEREMSGYRIVGDKVAQITSSEEVVSVESAMAHAGPLQPVSDHIRRAIELLADRQNPDYRNSIKEAVSAVETLSRLLTGDRRATLGSAIKKVDDSTGIHPALKDAFSKIYGYTSNEDGIRHAMMEGSDLGQEDALYMAVACSAFINYCVAKATKAGLTLELPS